MKNIITLVVLLTVFACNNKQEEKKAPEVTVNEYVATMTDEQIRNAKIVIGKIEKKTVSAVLKLNGTIDVPPSNLVTISFPLGGYLKSSKLLPGMQVNKGEAIAVIEDQQFIQLQQDYLTSKVKLVFLELEFNRQKELNQSKASSDKLFQQTQADYQSQKILVSALFQKLQLIGINPNSLDENSISRSVNIYSPIDGFISKVNVNIGKYVNPADVLFEIVNPDDIHLALNVFEKDVNKLSVGQKVIAYTNTNPEKKHVCEIILVGRELSADRSVEVHCHFKERDKTLFPGMFMNAEVEMNSNTDFALPSDAIVSYENKKYIFVQRSKNEFEMKEIKTGENEDGFTQIISGNENFENQPVVTQGAYYLLMKLKNIREE